MITYYTDKHKLHEPSGTLIDGRPFISEDVSARLEMILEALHQANLGEIRVPIDFGLQPILKIHHADYVEFLQNIFQESSATCGEDRPVVPETFAPRQARRRPNGLSGRPGYYAFGVGSPILKDTWIAAYWSAQCALSAAFIVKQGQPAGQLAGQLASYALCRPPGHHAGANLYGGFCYLNNAAIAARFLEARVAILDIDYHHGNGTQEIFYRDPEILYCSLHAHPDQDYPYYWGEATETGAGPGKGFNRNFPLPSGTQDERYLAALEEAIAWIRGFEAQYLVVSLGLDIALGDPAGGFAISTPGFAEIARRIRNLDLPTVLIQEGGYHLETLGRNAVAFLQPFN